ncbi:MAG: TIGR03905 family TSCPD domain-containing protein [Eubacteriales bacterium]|nr:TIGR03905 family TSCPD domain-containing protein [Eubacteriales bacterium]MDD3882531.1 TIGR03905 family TSCPD domain-containing protein [Eubacteriales bacterium]MDD4512831.1 TIGR03905 family TSCPD domain-containing protein [Eubacteriales bacterium]
MYRYKTQGTCSREIDLEIENGIITSCTIVGGCKGNTTGLARMVIGQKASEVQDKLRGILCRDGTSCPDQLSRAIESYHNEERGAED